MALPLRYNLRNVFVRWRTTLSTTLGIALVVSVFVLLRALGFDDRFIRKWTYYLGYCEAAFAMRNISVVHTLHSRANNLSL